MLDRPISSLVLALFALAGTSTAASAQIQEALPQWRIDRPLDPGVFGRAALADVDGDLLLDWAVLQDGVLEVVCGPSLFGARLTNVVQANDVARLPGDGAADALVVAGPAGVLKLVWDSVAVDWSFELLSDDDDWIDARRIAVGDDVAGLPSFVGLSEDGYSLRLLEFDGAQYQDRGIHDSLEEMIDVAVFDRFGDGQREIGATSAQAIGIFGVDNGIWTLDDLFDLTYFSSVGLAVGRDFDQGTQEWLAWVGDGPGATTQWLVTIRGAVSSLPMNLQGPRGIVGMTGGDWSYDGNTDLVLSWQETEQLPVLENFGAAFGSPFNIASQGEGVLFLDVGDPESEATSNQTWPVCGDLDGDGDEDVCFPVQSTESLYVALNPAEVEEELKPLIGLPSTPPPLLQGGSTLSPFAASLPDPDVSLKTRLDGMGAPIGEDLHFTVYVDAETVPTAATHVEVLLWRMADYQSTVDPEALESRYFDLDQGYTHPVVIPLQDGDTVPMDAIYFWTQRCVTRSGGVVTAVFPSRVYGFQTAGYGSPEWEWLDDESLMGWAPFDIVDEDTVLAPPTGGPILIGRGKAFACLPNLPENNPPRRP